MAENTIPESILTEQKRTEEALFSIRDALRSVDAKSITGLKDLSRAVKDQRQAINDIKTRLTENETNLQDVEDKVTQQESEISEISTVQSRIFEEMEKNNDAFKRKIDYLTDVVETNFGDIDKRLEALKESISSIDSGGTSNKFSFAGVGKGAATESKAAPSAPKAAAAGAAGAVGSQLLKGIPKLVKGALSGIGGIIGGLVAEVGSQYAYSMGYEQIGAGLDIASSAMAGAGIGGTLGSVVPGIGTGVGAAVGGALGAGYGLYENMGTLTGADISPQIKELQQESQRRQEAQQAEKQQYSVEHPAGQPPELAVPQPEGAPSVGRGGDAEKVGPIPPSAGLAQNQKLAYSAARAEGLSDSAARILVANMSGESLANPGKKIWDRKHWSQGIVQWDDERSARIKKTYGKFPMEMTVAEQVKAAIWEMRTDPNYREAWTKLNDEKLPERDRMFAVVNNYERPQYPQQDTTRRMRILEGMTVGEADKKDAQQQTTSPSTTPASPTGETTPTSTPQPQSGVTPQTTTPTTGQTPTSDKANIAQIPTGEKQKGSLPSGDIVALGKALQAQGVRVSEHPSFGGVHGVHVKGSAHYDGRAIDVNIGTGITEANDSRWGSMFDKLADQIKAAGYKVIWRAPGHYNHLHAQIGKGEGDTPTDTSAPQTAGMTAGAPTQEPPPPPAQIQPQSPISPMAAPAPMAAMGMPNLQGVPLGMLQQKLGSMGPGVGAIGMLGPLIGMLGGGMMGGGGLMPPMPMMPEIVPETIPMASMPEQNNINVIGSMANQQQPPSVKSQNHLTMNSRPDWLGDLAEGLLGSTYTGMSRPKYFGAGVGKM